MVHRTSVTIPALFWLLLLWINPVEPRSSGAPTCIPGQSAPGTLL